MGLGETIYAGFAVPFCVANDNTHTGKGQFVGFAL